VTGEVPEVAAHDPGFRLEKVPLMASADFVLDLGDGAAFAAAGGPRLWGAAQGDRILLGVDPAPGPEANHAARSLLEVLAAGEALWRILGHEPHRYDFRLKTSRA